MCESFDIEKIEGNWYIMCLIDNNKDVITHCCWCGEALGPSKEKGIFNVKKYKKGMDNLIKHWNEEGVALDG
jgi:hypothetical protein